MPSFILALPQVGNGGINIMSEGEMLKLSGQGSSKHEIEVVEPVSNLNDQLINQKLFSLGEGFADNPEHLRQSIPNRIKRISQDYILLGRELFSVMGCKHYEAWGYATYEDYVTDELGISFKKAERFRKLWKKCVKDIGINPNRFKDIYYSKVIIVSGVIDRGNADYWFDQARTLSSDELRYKVRKERDRRYGKVRDIVVLEAESMDDLSALSPPEPEVIKDLSESEILVQGDEENNGRILPERPSEDSGYENQLTRISFSLFPEQLKVVHAALTRAEQECGSDKTGNLLSLITTFYLANRIDSKNVTDEWVSYLLKRLETSVGGKFIWLKDKKELSVDELEALVIDNEENNE